MHLLLAAGLLFALDPSGHWEGAIHAPFGEVNIGIDLGKNGKGELAGTFDNPARNLKGFPLGKVEVEEKSVRLLLKASSGGGTFDGDLAADGKSISGVFVTAEGGYSVPFALTRTGDPRMEPAAKSPPIGKELEGAWNGKIDSNGVKMQLVLTMSNRPDGTSTGSLVYVEEGLEIPVAAIVQKGSDLSFEIKSVGGAYSGVLNAEGTVLGGTFTEGSFAAPLIFRRSDGRVLSTAP